MTPKTKLEYVKSWCDINYTPNGHRRCIPVSAVLYTFKTVPDGLLFIDNGYIELCKERLETEEEVKARVELENEARQDEIQTEYQEYLRLKEKFENGLVNAPEIQLAVKKILDNDKDPEA